MTESLFFSSNATLFHSRFYHHTINKHFHTPPLPLPSHYRRRGVRMDSSSSSSHPPEKEKIVVIMGATGCGKTSLSIDLAARYFSNTFEIINSDKMQVYTGLDITTNKIPLTARCGVPHHLLGEFPGDGEDFTPSDFRLSAGLAAEDIVSRGKLPIVVGGSNSLIYSLLVHRFDTRTNVFTWSDRDAVSTEFRYDCCFIWVDAALPVLSDYLCWRVDEMLDSGMFEELCEFYDSGGFAELVSRTKTGLRKAIGVAEFDGYFKKYSSGKRQKEWDQLRLGAWEDAVREIKENTCQLAKRQIGKIHKLREAGWDLHRVDATESFKELMRDYETTTQNGGRNSKTKKRKMKKKKWREVWGRDVLMPSVKIVSRFLKVQTEML